MWAVAIKINPTGFVTMLSAMVEEMRCLQAQLDGPWVFDLTDFYELPWCGESSSFICLV